MGADGSRQQLGFFDTQRMENCSFLPATDGIWRCMPFENAATEGWFSDAQCMQRLFLTPAGCATTPKYGYRASSTCPVTYEFHTLGALVTPAQIFTLSGTNCVMAAPLPGYRLFPSTGAVAPSAFVQGNFVVEP